MDTLKAYKGIMGYIPNAISPRVLNQKGLFSIHCDATQKIEVKASRINYNQPNLVKMIIPAALKIEIIKILEDYGIDHSVLFPDLDGLSEYINNRTKRIR